jgi:hypothetical protein
MALKKNEMRYKINSFLLIIATIVIGCGAPHFVNNEKISGGISLSYNFELAEISVTSFDNEYGFPVKYSKNDVTVCIISFEKFDNLDLIKKDYQNIEEYWILQEKQDSIKDFYASYKSNHSIFFQKEQKFVHWIKYPFNKHNLSKTSLIKFEKGKWYKLSHLNRKYDDLDLRCDMFVYVDTKGKVKKFHFYDGKFFKKYSDKLKKESRIE